MHVCHLALVYYMWCMITMSLILALMYENLHVQVSDADYCRCATVTLPVAAESLVRFWLAKTFTSG